MIKKYNEYINEKLSGKLSGFDEIGLRNQLLNGEINIEKYLDLCNKYKINFPNEEEIKQYLLHIKNDDIIYFIHSLIKYKLNIYDVDIIKPYFFNNNIDVDTYIDICKKYNFKLLTSTEIKKYSMKNNYDIYSMLFLYKKFKCEYPPIDDIKQYFLDKKISINNYLSICNSFYNIPIDKELKKLFKSNLIDLNNYNRFRKEFNL